VLLPIPAFGHDVSTPSGVSEHVQSIMKPEKLGLRMRVLRFRI